MRRHSPEELGSTINGIGTIDSSVGRRANTHVPFAEVQIPHGTIALEQIGDQHTGNPTGFSLIFRPYATGYDWTPWQTQRNFESTLESVSNGASPIVLIGAAHVEAVFHVDDLAMIKPYFPAFVAACGGLPTPS